MFLINVHKSQLRKRKRSRQRKRRGTSVQSTSTRSGDESTASPHRLEEEHFEEERRNSFAEEEDEEDLLPALALINSQQALLELIERHSEEGVEGLADLENLPGMIQAAPEDYELDPNDSSFRALATGGAGAAGQHHIVQRGGQLPHARRVRAEPDQGGGDARGWRRRGDEGEAEKVEPGQATQCWRGPGGTSHIFSVMAKFKKTV